MKIYRLHFYFISTFLFVNLLQAQQVYKVDSANNGSTFNACIGYIEDSGNGPGTNYGNNENYVITICADQANQILQLGSLYILLSGSDSVVFYDGPDTLSPVLYTRTGGGIIGSYLFTTQGCVTVQMVTDSSGSWEGLSIPFQCLDKPQNETPCDAEFLDVGAYCSYQYVDTRFADTTDFVDPGCAGYVGRDLWYKTVVPASGNIMIDTYEGSVSKGGLAVYTGTCSSLSLITCHDSSSSCCSDMPRYDGSGLTPGDTLWIQTWEENDDGGGYFYLCITEPVPPPNDSACSAFMINPAYNCENSLEQFSNEYATASGVPDPGCGNYSGGDVWFKTPVPGTGMLHIDLNGISIDDAAMAVYSGNCNNLTLIQCDDTSSVNEKMPAIDLYGLNPTDTIWIRVWENGNDSNGTFEICVTENPQKPSCAGFELPSDICTEATHLCDFQGYCGTTSDTYTVTNHLGENENSTQLGQAFFCGGLHNNSWLEFIAADTSILLNIWVDSCSDGDGIQMHMYHTDDCLNFTSVSECIGQMLPGNHQLRTTQPLTIGERYYLMIDGFNGDVCNYTITAASGVYVAGAISVETGTDFVSICKGQQTQLLARGGTKYQWSPDSSISNDTIASPMAFPDTTTEYFVTITGSRDVDPTCSDTTYSSMTVHVRSCDLYAGIKGTNPSCPGVCDGEAVVIPGGDRPPFVYNWDHGMGTDSIITGLCGGVTYNVTVTDSNGLGKNYYTSFTPVEPLPVELDFNTTSPSDSGLCDGSIEVTASKGVPDYSYQWDPPSGDTNALDNLCGDSLYRITVTDANGCIVTDSIYLPEAPFLQLNITGKDPLCYGDCNGSLKVNVSGGSGGYSYVWSSGGIPQTDSVSGLCPGKYTITVTDTILTFTDSISYTLSSPPQLILDTDTTGATCFGYSDGSAVVHASGGIKPYTYEWNDSASQTDSNAINLEAGNYQVIVRDSNLCADTAYVIIDQPAEFFATIQEGRDTTICLNDTIVLHAGQGSSYIWSPDVNIDSLTDQHPGVWPDAATNYIVSITNANGCSDTASIEVAVQNPPQAGQNGNVSVCANGDTLTLFEQLGGSPEAGGFWLNPNFTGHSGTINPDNDLHGNYTYIVTGNGICANDSAIVYVNILPVPVYSISPYPDTTIYMKEAVLITAAGDSSYTFKWREGGSTINIDSSPGVLVSPDSTTVYYVTVIDTSSSKNCYSIDSVVVYVKPLEFSIYNTFTPNGDGINDTWIIRNIEAYPDCEVNIYNRHGRLVYRKKGYQNDWEGTYYKTGKKLPPATYYYQLIIEDSNISVQGQLMIIR